MSVSAPVVHLVYHYASHGLCGLHWNEAGALSTSDGVVLSQSAAIVSEPSPDVWKVLITSSLSRSKHCQQMLATSKDLMTTAFHTL